MPAAGFMDDVKIILSQWDNGKVVFNDDKAVIDYVGPDKLPMKMWVKAMAGGCENRDLRKWRNGHA